jgi:hypothetical protein
LAMDIIRKAVLTNKKQDEPVMFADIFNILNKAGLRPWK